MLLDRADFALQEQPKDNLIGTNFGHGTMAHIPWPLSQSNPWKIIALYNDPVF